MKYSGNQTDVAALVAYAQSLEARNDALVKALEQIMTRPEAIDLVFDLVSAVREYEQRKDKYYRQQYEEIRERVINALSQANRGDADA
jgi:hypothetical protein